MIKFLIPMLFISNLAFAGLVVCPDSGPVEEFGSGDPQANCLFLDPPHTCTQGQFDSALSLFQTVPKRYIKVLSGFPVEMSPAEKVAVDDALAAEIETDLRTRSKGQFDGNNIGALGLRCLAKVINDRENSTAAKINAILNCNDNSANAGAFKTCVAGLSDLNETVTLAQAKTAIAACVDNLEADE